LFPLLSTQRIFGRTLTEIAIENAATDGKC
jgi:hypothetical protein